MGLWRKLSDAGRELSAALGSPGFHAGLAGEIAHLDAPTLIDMPGLYGRVDEWSAHYRDADPYPHIMLEDFIGADALRRALAEFPGPGEQLDWRQLKLSRDGDRVQDRKMGFSGIDRLGRTLRELLWELNSGAFLRFLELLTGIEGLIADPGLLGGGIHQVLPGGVLGVHADFTRHPHFDLDRRLNVLLYLNEDWPEEYGGDLELWSTDMSRCVRRIRPLAGRCVIFNTSAQSFHGHPRPLNCPPDRTRKSVALYYYTRGRDDAVVEPTRKTDWRPAADTNLPAPE